MNNDLNKNVLLLISEIERLRTEIKELKDSNAELEGKIHILSDHIDTL